MSSNSSEAGPGLSRKTELKIFPRLATILRGSVMGTKLGMTVLADWSLKSMSSAEMSTVAFVLWTFCCNWGGRFGYVSQTLSVREWGLTLVKTVLARGRVTRRGPVNRALGGQNSIDGLVSFGNTSSSANWRRESTRPALPRRIDRPSEEQKVSDRLS